MLYRCNSHQLLIRGSLCEAVPGSGASTPIVVCPCSAAPPCSFWRGLEVQKLRNHVSFQFLLALLHTACFWPCFTSVDAQSDPSSTANVQAWLNVKVLCPALSLMRWHQAVVFTGNIPALCQHFMYKRDWAFSLIPLGKYNLEIWLRKSCLHSLYAWWEWRDISKAWLALSRDRHLT